MTSVGDGAFAACYDLTSVAISNSVTSIERNLFYGCSSLTSITIPNGVTSIGERAFALCSSLTSFTIGNGITSIEDCAFVDCASLKDVYCYAKEVPNICTKIFSYPWENDSPIVYATLHVPAASIDAYSYANEWRDFGSIIALTDDDPKPTGITNINNDIEKIERYYSLDGKRMAQPQRGLNIIRNSDGTTSKVFVK